MIFTSHHRSKITNQSLDCYCVNYQMYTMKLSLICLQHRLQQTPSQRLRNGLFLAVSKGDTVIQWSLHVTDAYCETRGTFNKCCRIKLVSQIMYFSDEDMNFHTWEDHCIYGIIGACTEPNNGNCFKLNLTFHLV